MLAMWCLHIMIALLALLFYIILIKCRLHSGPGVMLCPSHSIGLQDSVHSLFSPQRCSSPDSPCGVAKHKLSATRDCRKLTSHLYTIKTVPAGWGICTMHHVPAFLCLYCPLYQRYKFSKRSRRDNLDLKEKLERPWNAQITNLHPFH